MGMIKEDLKKAKHKVEYLLETEPKTRDSDKLLWVRFMKIFRMIDISISNSGFNGFANAILHPDTPTFETISRARRKLQEMRPELRGELYHERQYTQLEVKKYLKEF